MTRPPTQARRIATALGLAVLVVACFAPVLDNGFIDVYDDGKYVTQNPNVQHGLDAASLRWALAATTASNWHPLTWISHILDVSISGLKPAGHHLTSVLLHALTTAVLFLALEKLTGDAGRSAAAAALFGVHPLRLESVAWVAERKDVLSGLLFVVVLLLYVRYVEAPRPRRMAAVAVALALGLMAKPMLVTAPFVLLLLDSWPLGRRESWKRLVLEKTPLFALSLVSCALTVWAQSAHAVRSLEEFPLGVRVENAIVAYAAYPWKTVWPAKLAVLYPHPGASIEAWKVIAALAVLGTITYLSFSLRRSKPWLPVGWLWYAGMLVPVIGLVQVGDAAMADRYTYLPSIGLAMMVCWSVPATRQTAIVAGAVVLALAAATRYQAGYWKDSVTLFTRAIDVTRENGIAQSNLGLALYQKGDLVRAIEHDEEAIRILPRFQPPRSNLGVALADAGRIDEAIASYQRAIELDPSDPDVYNNLGTTYYRTRRLDEATAAFREAVSRGPEHASARYNLGTSLAAKGDYAEAATVLREAVRLDPRNPSPHANLAAVLAAIGDRDGAWREVDAMRSLGREPSASLLEKLGPR